MDAAEEGVDILAGAATLEVGGDILSIPETLEGAENLRSLRVAVRTGIADLAGERASLDQCAMLDLDGTE